MNSELHLQYYDSNTLLLVNSKGLIRKLYTPFKVVCINAVGYIQSSTHVFVEEVLTNDRDEILYYIAGEVLSHQNFRIPISF